MFDEPTNHLDVTAKAELQRALKEYKGTVLLVSHEPDFYEDWVAKRGMWKNGPKCTMTKTGCGNIGYNFI